MSDQPIRVLFTGGGSGGPTIPLLALAQEVHKQKKEAKFLFLGSKNGPERKMVEQAKIPFAAIPSGKLRRYWSWFNFIDPLFILGGGISGLIHLLHFRPHVVVSAGSFVSVPVAYAAWFLRIPHIILQMDLRPGLANRLMAPVSNALVFYFESTGNQFPTISKKRKIGPVVRQEGLSKDLLVHPPVAGKISNGVGFSAVEPQVEQGRGGLKPLSLAASHLLSGTLAQGVVDDQDPFSSLGFNHGLPEGRAVEFFVDVAFPSSVQQDPPGEGPRGIDKSPGRDSLESAGARSE